MRPLVAEIFGLFLHQMAIIALKFAMFGDEFVASIPVMVKFDIVFPALQSMAGVTVFFGKVVFEKVNVIFFVTTDAA